jgi:type III pantothenate kinase
MIHVLTADLGNSFLKLRLFRSPEEARGVSAELVGACDLARASAASSDDAGVDGAALRAWLRGAPSAARVALCSVAGERATHALAAVLAEAVADVSVAPECGLAIRCREPERVGRDRLYAARAALALARAPAIVVDCGTALTVDAAGPGAVFHGGAIAPGPALLARTLGAGAAQLFTIDAPSLADVPALGRDTREALASGVVHGLRGAAERLVREVARAAGFAAPAVVATGGAVELLLAVDGAGEPLAAFAGARRVPDLVHHGLLLALGLAPPPAGGWDANARAPEGGPAWTS